LTELILFEVLIDLGLHLGLVELTFVHRLFHPLGEVVADIFC
jgi:hypothetical protein